MSVHRVLVCFVLLMSVVLIGTADADVIDVHIDAYIDGADDLALGGDYAFWYHGDFLRPGVPTTFGDTVPTWIDTKVNGVPTMAFPWIPQWPDNVNDQPQFSAIVHGLNPVLPSGPMEVELVDWYADSFRNFGEVSLLQVPSAANNWQVVLGFNDDQADGAEWYHADLRISPLPEPTSMAFMGLAGLGFVIRRRFSSKKTNEAA